MSTVRSPGRGVRTARTAGAVPIARALRAQPSPLLLAEVAGAGAALLLTDAALGLPAAVVVVAAGALVAATGAAVLRVRDEAARGAEASRRSLVDDLTGLAHRRVLLEALSAAVEPSPPAASTADASGDASADVAGTTGDDEADEELPLVALLAVDLDAFRDVNDRSGHAAGDALLREAAARVAGCLPASALLARVGDDEFAVLLRGDDAARARLVADGVATAVAATPTRPGARRTTVSVGVAFADVPEWVPVDPFGIPSGDADLGEPSSGPLLGTAEELLRCSQVALRAAKAAGGGVRLYETAGDLDARERALLADELRAALAEPAGPSADPLADGTGATAQLVVHYQPQVDARSSSLGGLEALVRWRHPRHGLVGPDTFVDIAEEQGLALRLTEHVLRTALHDARTWHEDGHRVRVAVNVSSSCLTQAGLLPLVDSALLDSGVDPGLLVVEVTETTLMREPQQALATARRLRERGVQLSIDDYGTGYSSLAYLSDLPATELKLDRSFTLRMLTDAKTAAIVASTVDLAHRLGLRLVVEGVEDAQTQAALEAAGCDETQGYLHGRPQPAAVVSRWLALGRSPAAGAAEREEVVALAV